MFGVVSHFHFSLSEGWLVVVWICTSLMSNEMENYILCLLSIHIFFGEGDVQPSAHVYSGLGLQKLRKLFILQIFWVSTHFQICRENIFSQNMVLDYSVEGFSFDGIYQFLMVIASCTLPIPQMGRYSSVLSSRSFMAFISPFRSGPS